MSILWMPDDYRVLLKTYLAGHVRNTRTDTCSSATLSTTNPMWTDLGANPRLRGEKPTLNAMRHGATELPHTQRECEASNCERIF